MSNDQILIEDNIGFPVRYKPYKISSGNLYPGGSFDPEYITSNIKKLSLNTINIPIRCNQDDNESVNIVVEMSDIEKINPLILLMESLGINVLIELYPWVSNGTVPETAINPSDYTQWFSSMKKTIDIIKTKLNGPIWGITVGSNLVNLEQYHEEWDSLFGQAKLLFECNILYRRNFWVTASWAPETIAAYNAILNNPIFSSENLDIISIAAYFELNNTNDPTKEDLVDDFSNVSKFSRGQNILKEIKDLNSVHKKMIFFGELGCATNSSLAASEPWSNTPQGGMLSEIAASNLFSAYREVFAYEDWWLGFSIFQINTENSEYYPINTLSEKTIREFGTEVSNIMYNIEAGVL